jgi:uncharacterized protein (TIGR02453 family)
MATRHFGPSLFAFLRELKTHNTREWFADNKARFVDDVEAPMRQFITDLAPRLRHISPRFRADPRRVGGSMHRIHRDTRFSHDKTPYKTAVAARFVHDAKDQESVPGFYLHLSPGRSVGGGGIYHPDPRSLHRIRETIARAPTEWRDVSNELDVEGETLKRVPLGFDKDHPLADDLKRKDHYVMAAFTARQVTAPGFLDLYVDECARIAPLVRFLTRAMGLRW